MMIPTTAGVPMDARMLNNYLFSLIDLIFKILPMKEEASPYISVYMRSLQAELLGCSEFISATRQDGMLLSLVSILQYLIDHPDRDVDVVKREVFKAIGICKRLQRKYASAEEVEHEPVEHIQSED